MNTTVRLLNKGTFSPALPLSLVLTKTQVLFSTIIMSVLLSALGIVYVTHMTRNMNAGIQQMLAERSHLHIQWGQLLLQKSTWTMQAHIQHVAENKLDMVIPDHNSVMIVN